MLPKPMHIIDTGPGHVEEAGGSFRFFHLHDGVWTSSRNREREGICVHTP